MASKYKAKKAEQARIARSTPTAPAADMGGYSGKPQAIITPRRFAEVIEYGLQQRYQTGEFGVTKMEYDYRAAAKRPEIQQPSGGFFVFETGRRNGDMWHTQNEFVLYGETVYQPGSGASTNIPVSEAIKVAERLGIRTLTAAKAWEDIAKGNHEFFGWTRKRPEVMEALFNRAPSARRLT